MRHPRPPIRLRRVSTLQQWVSRTAIGQGPAARTGSAAVPGAGAVGHMTRVDRVCAERGSASAGDAARLMADQCHAGSRSEGLVRPSHRPQLAIPFRSGAPAVREIGCDRRRSCSFPANHHQTADGPTHHDVNGMAFADTVIPDQPPQASSPTASSRSAPGHR